MKINKIIIKGTVIHGFKIGTKIGFPTANIKIYKNFKISNGVYIAATKGILNHKLPSITNIGIKPTYSGKKRLLEVHIFNINSNLYKKKLEIILYKKIRSEIKFNSKIELIKQIKQDILNTSNYFNTKYLNKIFLKR